MRPDVEKCVPEATQSLVQGLLKRLEEYRAIQKKHPTLNAIERLSVDICRLIATGDLELARVDDLVQALSGDGFVRRADRMVTYLNGVERHQKVSKLRQVLSEAAERAGSVEAFAELLDREIAGIVITAHPTFGMDGKLYRILAKLVEHKAGCRDHNVQALIGEMLANPHAPPDDISLGYEYAEALAAIENIQLALREVYRIALAVGAEQFPDDWRSLSPRLLTVATWVAYDLDGRSDISWDVSLRTRFQVARRQLDDYSKRWTELTKGLDGKMTGSVSSRLASIRAAFDDMLSGFEGDLSDVKSAQHLGLQLQVSSERKPSDVQPVLDELDEICASIDDQKRLVELKIFRAEIANFGFGFAHTHVRLNATQLHNAIQRYLQIDGSPDEPGNRRRFMGALTDLFDGLEPKTVNIGSLMAERTSAKRLFMVVSHMLQYVDRTQPVRFLIAECDTPFTLLCAVYFAKLFGVDDKLDISPLFETSTALERGEQLISKLLDNRYFVEYIRKRGRLCIQTGFSDAGRYLGQTSASMAIERLRMKLVRLLAHSGLSDVELVIFDTHGESIGRGAHPLSFAHRVSYTSPPASRALMNASKIKFKQEVSFQGGDGYLLFQTEDLAFATLTELLSELMKPVEKVDDLFYSDTSTSLDFFITTKAFNEALLGNENYAALLGVTGPNLLFKTGSRAVKRQREGTSSLASTHPSHIRAIPNNAILQQIGFMSNSLSGLGTAILNDQEQFEILYEGSPRCRSLLSLAARAYALSNLDVLKAYTNIKDPGYWLTLADAEEDTRVGRLLGNVASALDRNDNSHRLKKIVRRLQEDSRGLRIGLEAVGLTSSDVGVHDDDRDLLQVTHALRIALICYIYILGVQVPRFSSQADVTLPAVLDNLLALNVREALDIFRSAFPADGQSIEGAKFGQVATYVSDSAQGYAGENDSLFDPMAKAFDLLRRLGTVVSHHVGAFG